MTRPRSAQRNDSFLPEMEPPDTFTYTLRPYQKQALQWVVLLMCVTRADLGGSEPAG